MLNVALLLVLATPTFTPVTPATADAAPIQCEKMGVVAGQVVCVRYGRLRIRLARPASDPPYWG